MARIRERWRPSSVVGMAVVALFGLGVIAVALAAIVLELWGEPLSETVGIARPKPVWFAWIGVALGIVGGGQIVVSSVGYLYRVATGRVPRVQEPKKASRKAR